VGRRNSCLLRISAVLADTRQCFCAVLWPTFRLPASGVRESRTCASRALRRVIEWCVSWRVTVVLVTVGIFVLSIVAFGRVQQQFFPLSERPELFFQLRMPAGTAFGTTLQAVKKAEVLVKGDNDISTLHRLCRPRLAAVLARPQSTAARRVVRRDRGRLERRRGAGADGAEVTDARLKRPCQSRT
jgi:hypothetical protein